MDRLGAVGTAITTVLRAGSTGVAVGTANVFDSYAFRGSTPPYIVHQVNSETPEFSTSSEVSRSVWSIMAVSAERWPDEARRIAGLIDTDLHDGTISVSGGTVIRCRRMSSIVPIRDETQHWYAGGLYVIEFSKSLGG